jgi:hypothetical protein
MGKAHGRDRDRGSQRPPLRRKAKILALCRNIVIAQATFEEAVKQRPGKRVRLAKGAQVHGDSGGK